MGPGQGDIGADEFVGLAAGEVGERLLVVGDHDHESGVIGSAGEGAVFVGNEMGSDACAPVGYVDFDSGERLAAEVDAKRSGFVGRHDVEGESGLSCYGGNECEFEQDIELRRSGRTGVAE